MKLRYLLVLAAAGVLLLGTSDATGVTRHPTTITIDSSVDVGGGYFVDSGRVFTNQFFCSDRPVQLIGTRPDGREKLLDWTLLSIPGNAWAAKSKRTAFETVKAKMPKTKHCKAGSILVFPR